MSDIDHLRNLTDKYWDIAWCEGRDGRHHDSELNEAQICRSGIEALLSKLQARSESAEPVGFIPSSGLNNLAAGHPARVYPTGITPSPFESHSLIYTTPPTTEAGGVPEGCQHQNTYRTGLGYIVCYECQKNWHPDDELPDHLKHMRPHHE